MTERKNIDMKPQCTTFLAEQFAGAIRAKRGNLTLRQAAAEIGDISFSTLARYEKGQEPSFAHFRRICKWIEQPPDTFILPHSAVAPYISSKQIESRVEYLADALINTLRVVLSASGVGLVAFNGNAIFYHSAITYGLRHGTLSSVCIEASTIDTECLVKRWDFNLAPDDYDFPESFANVEEILYQVGKAGAWGREANYDRWNTRYTIAVGDEFFNEYIAAWRPFQPLSSDGFVKQSIGTVIWKDGISVDASYWRRLYHDEG